MKTISYTMPGSALNNLLSRMRAEGYLVGRDHAAGTVHVSAGTGETALVAIQHGKGGTWLVRAEPWAVQVAA